MTTELSRTEYLYGFKPEVIRDMPNLESLYYRKEHAWILARELVEIDHVTRHNTGIDTRLDAILDALKWLDRAIKELT